MAQREDLSAYQALYQQFRDDNAEAETGQLGSMSARLGDDADADVRREPIEYLGDQGFLLRRFLTDDECRRLVDAAEAEGLGDVGCSELRRSCTRRVFHSPQLAADIFRRLRPHLPTIRVADDPVACGLFGPPFQLRGVWAPACLNPILRVCRYLPGQHFAPHFDGHLVHSATNRSLQTFMVYLTDNPEGGGGATNFLDDSLPLSRGADGRYAAPAASVRCSVRPARGTAIVFNHYRLHEGEPLLSGVKYILRSDVMFERTAGERPTEAQTRALLLLQEAERLESGGRADEAVHFYRRAFRLCPELELCS